jgi:hypothetical protein
VLTAVEILLRDRGDGDNEAIVRMSLQSSAYYSQLAPDLFSPAEEEGVSRTGLPMRKPL